MALQEHPLNRLVAEEIHARPITPLPAPLRVRRIVALLEGSSTVEFCQRLNDDLHARGLNPTGSASMRRISFEADTCSVVVEAHTEFVTLTWAAPASDGTLLPPAIRLDGLDALQIISRTRVDIRDEPEIGEKAIAGFDPISLCHSEIEGGICCLAGDFVPDATGFTRYELAAGNISDIRRGIIVRRILEIDTYRAMALLGLPLARTMSVTLTNLEDKLVKSIRNAAVGQIDNLTLLNNVHDLQAAVSSHRESSRYRLAAMAAYGAVLSTRLSNLNERDAAEGRTLSRFLLHRVAPALSTAAAVARRFDDCLEEIRGTIDVLNAKFSFGGAFAFAGELAEKRKALRAVEEALAKSARDENEAQPVAA